MPYARAGDLSLYYERAGSGPRVLVISGTGSDLRERPGVFDSPLPRHLDVVAYDHRDQGRSGRPAGPYAMADYAADAVAVLDAVGWERAAVLGISFGGMVAQELAVRHPERVERLVLACTSSGGAGGTSYPLHELEELPDDERLRTLLGLSDVRIGRDWQDAHPEQAAVVLRLAGERPRPSRLQLQARRGHDTYDRLAGLRIPTLVAAGRHDAIAPPANSEALVARLPDADLRVFDGGHLFLLQDPAAYPAVVDFLTT